MIQYHRKRNHDIPVYQQSHTSSKFEVGPCFLITLDNRDLALDLNFKSKVTRTMKSWSRQHLKSVSEATSTLHINSYGI